MDEQTQKFFKRLDEEIFKPRTFIVDNCQSIEIKKLFTLASKSIVYFYLLMSQNNESKEILFDMFVKASNKQLDEAHRLLTFWFIWQRDWARGLNFLQSEKVCEGLEKVWSFDKLEIDNLIKEFYLESESNSGAEVYCLWEKLENILDNHFWSPTFVFPALSASLKEYWTQLDFSVGDSI